VLNIEKLNAGYGSIQVLHDVSLEVKKGEVVTLIGANNSGKSTLLRTIVGLHKPSSGTINFNGADLANLDPHKIVNMGVVVVPEGRGLFPEMTVQENLLLGSYSQRVRRERQDSFETVYQLFPVLKERRKQVAGDMSGGEQQMLAIGRALMAQPEILLLDEPSLALAPLLVREVFQTLQELNRKGLSILLVEQNMKLALSISSRGYVIANGRICFSGDSMQLSQDEEVRKAYLGKV